MSNKKRTGQRQSEAGSPHIQLDLRRTPPVSPGTLRDALFKFVELGTAERFEEWLLARYPTDTNTRVAVWARVRAFGSWQAAQAPQAEMHSGDSEAIHAEAVARIGAASKHPLASDGQFAKDFDATIERARCEMRGYCPTSVAVN